MPGGAVWGFGVVDLAESRNLRKYMEVPPAGGAHGRQVHTSEID